MCKKLTMMLMLISVISCTGADYPGTTKTRPIQESRNELVMSPEHATPVVGDSPITDDGIKIEVSGPTTRVEYGDIVDLQVVVTGEKPKDLLSISYSWTIIPPPTTAVTFPDKSRIVFGTGNKPKTVTAILTASLVFVIRNDGVIVDVSQQQHTILKTIEIGPESPAPDEPDEPDEPDGPTPPQPDPMPDTPSGLRKYVLTLKKLVSAPENSVRSTAKSFAAAYRGNAAAIAAGAYNDNGTPDDVKAKIRQIVADMTTANRLIVQQSGSSPEVWRPFFTQLSSKLGDLYTAGYNNQKKIADLWIEIAEALEQF